jgi:hypothetical protein
MSNPEPKIHQELSDFAQEIGEMGKKIGRLETLLEIQDEITKLADQSKSAIEVRAYTKVIKLLERMN